MSCLLPVSVSLIHWQTLINAKTNYLFMCGDKQIKKKIKKLWENVANYLNFYYFHADDHRCKISLITTKQIFYTVSFIGRGEKII